MPIIWLYFLLLLSQWIYPVTNTEDNSTADTTIIKISADTFHSSLSTGTETTTLTGNAHVITNNRSIKAQTIELYGTNYRFFRSIGTVTIIDNAANLHITGSQLFYDRKRNLIRLTGNVTLEDNTNQVLVQGNYIEYSGENDILIIQVNARIFKDEIITRSEFAQFNRKTLQLDLSGLPIVYYNEDKYQSDQISVNLNTKSIEMQGNVSGSLIQENNQTKKDAS